MRNIITIIVAQCLLMTTAAGQDPVTGRYDLILMNHQTKETRNLTRKLEYHQGPAFVEPERR